jgi:PAS domain S-box-containing protein
MTLELTLFTGNFYLEAPQGLLGWLGWMLQLALSIALLYRWGQDNRPWTTKRRMILLGLLLLVPLTSLFLVLRLPAGSTLPPPGIPVDPFGSAIIVFSFLPWMLGVVMLGAIPAAGLALFSGIILAFAETHSSFTPLEVLLAAVIFSGCIGQVYRTFTFRALRHPLVIALLLAFLYPLVYMVNILLITKGVLAERLDYALSNVFLNSIAFGVQLITAGIFVEALILFLPQPWPKRGPWLPSPAERSLEMRFFFNIAPLALAALLLLVIGDWQVAERASRQMLQEQMGTTAKVASKTIPYYHEAGQNLIQQLSQDSRLLTVQSQDLPELLEQQIRSVPFFRQLYLLDDRGRTVAGYPLPNQGLTAPSTEERIGIQLALQGVQLQYYTLPPGEGDRSAQVSFIAAILNDDDSVRGVMVGRSDLYTNPLTQPVIASLAEIAGTDGEGILLDSSGRIIYHTSGPRPMEPYNGKWGSERIFFDDTAPDGTRRIVYNEPAVGHPWTVILSVPAKRAQQMALNIAGPLLGIVAAVFIAALVMLRFGLRSVTASLFQLSHQANMISQGQLGHALQTHGDDEVGKLRRSFEQMRVSLKARLDELNRLLLVSQGVASTLEIEEAVKPILEAVQVAGASSSRIVLVANALPGFDDGDEPARFGHGSMSELYSLLDEQVLTLARQQERILLTNLSRISLFNLTPGHPVPKALAAIALRHENNFYGVLWQAYDQPHQFSEDEIRYLTTLAGQAAIAAANSRLFQSAEIGRQRLAAILTSTPDPILVTDRQNRLLLSNPAAWQVLGFTAEVSNGQSIKNVTTDNELIYLLSTNTAQRQSAEVTMPDGKIYLATASPVVLDGQRMGRVCLLRDITHLKELDALKSEFVSTVSHDLRSPLTLMRGYATMLEMVGDLNEQQNGYVGKIVLAVENMARLVNNLLDLGRIEAGVDLQLEMVSVQDVVDRVVNALQLQMAQKRIQLQINIDPQSSPLIEADQALLQQALQNLVENAVKYTNDGGKIFVSIHPGTEGLIFKVTDTGIGIAPVDQPRLFEKFYRVGQRDAKKEHGTGLGLAIVKSIAERHRGRVWVESQLGKGSSFYILLPLRQARRERQLVEKKNI